MSVDGEEKERSTVWGLVVAVVVAMGCVIARLPGLIGEYAPRVRAGDYAEFAGAVTGQATGIVLVIWAVLYFSFVRRRAPGRGWRYFAILLAAALATEWGAIALSKWAADRDNAQERIAKTEMSKAFSTVINPDSGAIDMRIKAQGDAGEMERLSKFGAAKTLASARKYRETLAALDFPAFVGPARLAADPGLVQTREKLRQARAAVQTYRTEIGANIADIQAEIRKSQMSEAHKTEFATGFAESSAKSHKNAERTLDCEDGILAEFDAIADLLSRAKGRWSVKGKTIEFTNAQDLASYQAHISKIRQFSQEESEFVATQKSSMTSAQNEFMHGD